MARPMAPRPWGKRAQSSFSKQMRCPVRGQTSAHSQSRRAKLTVAPEARRPLPCTHTQSWNAVVTSAIGAQRAS